MAETIPVEVAYALADKQTIIALEVTPGTTAIEAVKASGIVEQFPDIDPEAIDMGVFGKACPPNTVLVAYDRVELYRPLIADPKEVRKQRASAGKKMKNRS
jgi:uncharacterized protein